MTPEDPHSNVVPISKAISPAYAMLDKFETGDKQKLGRRAGMVDRTIGRYLQGVRGVVETVIAKGEELVELPPPSNEVTRSVTVGTSTEDNVIDLQVHVRSERRTLRERAAAVATVFSQHGGEVLNQVWDQMAGRSTLLQKALHGTGVGLVGAWVSGQAGATLPEIAFGGLAAASAIVAGYAVYAQNKVKSIRGSETGGHPLLVLEHGYDQPKPLEGNWHFPNPRFMDLARDALRAHVLDADLADDCIAGMAQEFALRVGRKDPCTIMLHGVEMDTSAGEYSIHVPDVDAENGWRKVASQRGGMLVEIDPAACARLRDNAMTPAPAPRPA